MKAVKLAAILFLVYVGIVVTFQLGIVALIGGYFEFQPTDIGVPVLVITTTAGYGTSNDRVLGRMESHGQLFVSANHWPRAWYDRALENPNVQVTLDGEKADYLAVPVTGEEHDRIIVEYPMPTVVRFLTGFPPRSFLRLDSR